MIEHNSPFAVLRACKCRELEDLILKKIKWEVCSRILREGKFKRTMSNERICCRWGIDMGILV
jgi:hypothetical protein